jgi:uncharacterized protein
MHRASLPFLAFVVAATALARAADEPSKGVWVTTIQGQEICRESFELTSDGWSVKGKLDLPGRAKTDFEIVEKRAGDVLSIAFKGMENGQNVAIDATLTADEYRVKASGATEPRVIKLDGKKPLAFQNLAWCYFIDVGRMLVARATAGSLKKDDAFDLLEVASAQFLPLKASSYEVGQRPHAGVPTAFFDFHLVLAGMVEMTFVTTASGIPVYVSVPGQALEVVADGWSDAKPSSAKPHTILDSGDWRALLSKSDKTVTASKKVMVPMRDGVKLAADLHRPDSGGKFPTVLVRTPYGRETMGVVYGSYYASRGYAVVVQDVRGRYDSEGTFEPMRHETEDGSDTLDWIAAQSWSNGDVGMIGGSYVGWVQWHAAKSGNPHLKAIIPQVSPPDVQENIPYEGGCFVMGSVWWARVAEDMSRLGNEKIDWVKQLATLPLTDLDKAFGLKLGFLDQWVSHPPHDPWWDAMCYQKDFSKLDVPALNLSGWYDGDQPGAPINFVNMRKSAKSERARKGQRLVMGPWTHLFNSSSHLGDWEFGPDAVVDLESMNLRWFDHYLKGIDNGVDREDPVLVFTMGENKWHAEKDWPLPQTKWTNLYLGGSGKANKRDGGGTLALEAGDSPADHYAYDPSVLPEESPDFDDLSGKEATKDHSKDPDHDYELEFTSPPLAAPIEFTGPLSVVLSVTTDAKDTDFAAGLMRLEPSGKTTFVRGGIQRLRYRNGNAKEDFAKPGEISKVTIDCWAHSMTLDAGDRLRVVVTSSAFPDYARNLNTGEPDATATKMVTAHQTIFHDKAHPSYLVLPVIPRAPLGDLRFAPEK